MKTLFGLGILGIIVAVVVITTFNGLVRSENQIEAFDKNMQNVHANFYTQLEAQDLAVDKYGDMVMQAISVGMSGRYGKDGVRGAMLWIQEQNQNIDSATINKLQVIIEAGYNKFEAAQQSKIDAVKLYKDSLGTFPRNIIAGMFGFPRIDKDLLERIITSGTTKKDFESRELSKAPVSRRKSPEQK